MTGGTYRLVPYDEYNEQEIEVDSEGNEIVIYTNEHHLEHPNARISPDKTEVIISTNHHGQHCGCLTHEQAKAHIAANWIIEPEEDV